MAVIRCADVAAARLCRGGCCAHAAAPLSRETAGDAARRRRTLRSSDGPQRGVRGAARRSASASAPALTLSVAAIGANLDFLPSVWIFLSFLSSLFRAPPRQICEKFLRPSFAPFRVRKQGVPDVGPGTVRACRALLEPAGPRGSDGAPPRRG